MTCSKHSTRVMAMAVLLVRAAIAFAQQSWSLDPSFQTAIVTENVSSLALLPNGKILISGRINFTNSPLLDNWSTMRLNANGSRDATFPPPPQSTGGGGKITAWNDKFYIQSTPLLRSDENGINDPSFVFQADQFFTSEGLGDYFVYPDGSVVIVGLFSLNYANEGYVGLYNMVWLTNTGSVDLSRPPRRGGGVTSRRLCNKKMVNSSCQVTVHFGMGSLLDTRSV